MKEKIKLVIVFVLGIMISVVISVTAATVITASEVTYTSNSNTTVQAGLDNLYTKANNLSNRVTTLEGYAKIPTAALFINNKSTAYTHASLKTAAGLFVTLQWSTYYVTQPVLLSGVSYHFVFDKATTMYTAVVVWNKSTGTVSVTNRSDVYVSSIVVIN